MEKIVSYSRINKRRKCLYEIIYFLLKLLSFSFFDAEKNAESDYIQSLRKRKETKDEELKKYLNLIIKEKR